MKHRPGIPVYKVRPVIIDSPSMSYDDSQILPKQNSSL
jgi:hypothetical protein